jgi:hypothetical protein
VAVAGRRGTTTSKTAPDRSAVEFDRRSKRTGTARKAKQLLKPLDLR